MSFPGIRLVLAGVLASALALAQDPQPLRRGSYAEFSGQTDICDPAGATVRKSTEGEIVRIRKVEGDRAEISSGRPELAGGLVPLSSLVPSTPEANATWVANGAREAGLVDQQLMGLKADPPSKEEAALEENELKAQPISPPAAGPAATAVREPLIGWFAPGSATEMTDLAQGPDGSVILTGTARPPFAVAGARAWSGELPSSDSPESPPLVFLARLASDLKSMADFVVFRADEISAVKRTRIGPDGSLWIAAGQAGEALAGPDAAKATTVLIRFAPDLRSITRTMALVADIRDFQIDACGRPIGLTGSPRRSGGGFLTRYFSTGRFERGWPDAPDGSARRVKLDFSSPALAEGPFALWAKKGEVYPDMPTPIGPWGSPRNAGQQMAWTNVKSGQNPIRGADLKPEAMEIDKGGGVVVAGTIPFNMGFPDFDPFLMKFSPEGKLLWTNCFLNGLLSEPDQKTQALGIDPSNGDILVCYWQHGNNQRTLLLDPNGWLTKFTGTNGNIKITWIGRVDAGSGVLKNSTYIHSQMPEQKNPRWPDLNSSTVNAMQVAANGQVYAAGGTTISYPTTSNAWLPAVNEYGGHPMLTVLRPDLSAPHYSTYLSAGQGSVDQLAVLPGGAALCTGKHSTEGTALQVANTKGVSFLRESPPEGQKDGAFLAIIPIPSEEAEWSFNN